MDWWMFIWIFVSLAILISILESIHRKTKRKRAAMLNQQNINSSAQQQPQQGQQFQVYTIQSQNNNGTQATTQFSILQEGRVITSLDNKDDLPPKYEEVVMMENFTGHPISPSPPISQLQISPTSPPVTTTLTSQPSPVSPPPPPAVETTLTIETTVTTKQQTT